LYAIRLALEKSFSLVILRPNLSVSLPDTLILLLFVKKIKQFRYSN